MTVAVFVAIDFAGEINILKFYAIKSLDSVGIIMIYIVIKQCLVTLVYFCYLGKESALFLPNSWK